MSGLAAVVAAASVVAQSYQQFRDSRTATLWTPQSVGQDNRLSRDNRLEPPNQPLNPADKAFDPQSQIATVGAITVQRPRANVMGTVPATAAATRLGVPVYGPRADIFVDRVLCRVLVPS